MVDWADAPPGPRPDPTPRITHGHRFVHPDGRTFEELNAETGAFKVTDMNGRHVEYTHAERVVYMSSLAEQFIASRDTVPRLPVLRV